MSNLPSTTTPEGFPAPGLRLLWQAQRKTLSVKDIRRCHAQRRKIEADLERMIDRLNGTPTGNVVPLFGPRDRYTPEAVSQQVCAVRAALDVSKRQCTACGGCRLGIEPPR